MSTASPVSEVRPDERQSALALGGVLLALALAIAQVRMEEAWSDGVHLVTALVVTAVLLGQALAWNGTRIPRGAATALALAGIAAFAVVAFRFLVLIGDDDVFDEPRSLVAFLALVAAVAGIAYVRTRSPAVLLAAALLAGGTVLAAVRWISDSENVASFRPVLLVLAVLFAAAGYALRALPRHRDVLVDAAGVAVLAIASLDTGFFIFFFGGSPPAAWEGVILAGGLALVVYGVATRAPGPSLLALVLLLTFASGAISPGEPGFDEGAREEPPDLMGWPLVLVVGSALAFAAAFLRGGRRDPGPVETELEVRL